MSAVPSLEKSYQVLDSQGRPLRTFRNVLITYSPFLSVQLLSPDTRGRMANTSAAFLEKVGIWIISNSINTHVSVLACVLHVMLLAYAVTLQCQRTEIIWPFTNSCNYVVVKIKTNENMQHVFMDVMDSSHSSPVITAVKIYTTASILISGILEMCGKLM